jgi:hypothetical protein
MPDLGQARAVYDAVEEYARRGVEIGFQVLVCLL